MSIKEKLQKTELDSVNSEVQFRRDIESYSQQAAAEQRKNQQAIEQRINEERKEVESEIRKSGLRDILAEAKELFSDAEIVEEDKWFSYAMFSNLGRALQLRWNFGTKTEYVPKLGGLYAVPKEVPDREYYDYFEITIYPSHKDPNIPKPVYRVLFGLNTGVEFDYRTESKDRLEELIAQRIHSPQRFSPATDNRAPGLGF